MSAQPAVKLAAYFSTPEQVQAFKAARLTEPASFESDLPRRQAEMRERMAIEAKKETESERQRRQDEQQQKLNRFAESGSDCRAALIILTSPMFRGDPRVWRHVDLDHHRTHFTKILTGGGWSHGQYRMLKIAASLFNHRLKINLYEVLRGLDHWNETIVLQAICALLGRRYSG